MSKQFETVARWLDKLNYVETDDKVVEEMSEYIIKAADWAIDYKGESLFKDCEEIVRCRDCDYYDHWDASGPYREKHVCGYWDYLEIKPDGFCAWGERKNE